MIIPAPAPSVVEDVIAGIMDGSSAFARWVKLVYADESGAAMETRLSELPWWADAINPENVELNCLGAGPTPEEAAAAAWVHASVGAWFDRETDSGTLTQEEYLGVPRRVPPGWRFGIYWFLDNEPEGV